MRKASCFSLLLDCQKCWPLISFVDLPKQSQLGPQFISVLYRGKGTISGSWFVGESKGGMTLDANGKDKAAPGRSPVRLLP